MRKGKKEQYLVRSVIICDDARQEANGKEILIGVYNDAVIAKAFPVVLQQLIIRIAFVQFDRDLENVNVVLKNPGGEPIATSGRTLPPLSDDPARIFGVRVRNLAFQEQGTYEIWMGVDEEPKKIWDFRVRLPKDEREATRLN